MVLPFPNATTSPVIEFSYQRMRRIPHDVFVHLIQIQEQGSRRLGDGLFESRIEIPKLPLHRLTQEEFVIQSGGDRLQTICRPLNRTHTNSHGSFSGHPCRRGNIRDWVTSCRIHPSFSSTIPSVSPHVSEW